MQSLDQFLAQAGNQAMPTSGTDPMVDAIMQAPLQQQQLAPQQQAPIQPAMSAEQWMKEFEDLQKILQPAGDAKKDDTTIPADVNKKPEEPATIQPENVDKSSTTATPIDNLDELIKQAQEYQAEAETKIADLEFKETISKKRIAQLEQMVEQAMAEKMTIAQKVDFLNKDVEVMKAQKLPEKLSALSQFMQVYEQNPQSVATQHRVVSELSKLAEMISGRKFDQYLEDRLS